MAGKDVTIRAQALDGTWQVIGSEAGRGVYPEGVVLEADPWGSSGASASLRRDPTVFWPDITAFTPIEVEVASRRVWSGRVKETPAQVAQRMMNVQCEGWQFHLDDDLYQRTYVHSALTDWKDARSNLAEDLTLYNAAGTAQTGGAVVLGWPKGTAVSAGQRVGVTLDLGHSNTCAYARAEFTGVTGPANIGAGGAYLFVRAHDRPNEGGSNHSDAGTLDLTVLGASTGSITGTFSPPYRYVTIFVYAQNAITLTGDVMVRVDAARMFADPAYAGGGALSVLSASTVVRDALSRATVLLSADLSEITDTAFDIPSYAPEWRTARQAWSAVDGYHDWMKMIDVDRRPIYQAKPSRPLFEVGVWSAINDDDASANSGAEIYNRAIGVAQAPDGSPVIADGAQTDETLDYSGIGQIPNPSADVNASGWIVTAGSLTRVTGTFDSAPACFDITPGGSGTFNVASATAGAQFMPLRKYQMSFALLPEGVPGDQATVSITTTPSNSVYSIRISDLWPPSAGSGWRTHVIDWLQPSDVTDTGYWIGVAGTGFAFANSLAVDSFDVARVVTTLVDRRGFRRAMQLPVNSTLPADGVALRAIGGVWLNAHRTTPFRGTITLVGDESLRDILTGAPVPLETLLLNVGQLIRFSDRSDPDTAGQGRDGRIAHVSYTPATNTAVVTIDNSRTSLEALLARLAVIQG